MTILLLSYLRIHYEQYYVYITIYTRFYTPLTWKESTHNKIYVTSLHVNECTTVCKCTHNITHYSNLVHMPMPMHRVYTWVVDFFQDLAFYDAKSGKGAASSKIPLRSISSKSEPPLYTVQKKGGFFNVIVAIRQPDDVTTKC